MGGGGGEGKGRSLENLQSVHVYRIGVPASLSLSPSLPNIVS